MSSILRSIDRRKIKTELDQVVKKLHKKGPCAIEVKTNIMYRKVMGMKLSDITPQPIFHNMPSRENKFAFPPSDHPSDLPHRILSYLDQQIAPIDPRALCDHFVKHSHKTVTLRQYMACIGSLLKHGSVVRRSLPFSSTIRHYFYTTSGKSRGAWEKRQRYLNKYGKEVPTTEPCHTPNPYTTKNYKLKKGVYIPKDPSLNLTPADGTLYGTVPEPTPTTA